MLKDLAKTLLADAVASEIESELQDPLRESDGDTTQRIRDAILQPQRDICEMLTEFCDEHDLDLDAYLPTDLIERMEADLNARLQGRLTLSDLYGESTTAAHRLVLNAVGHGVSADDDRADRDWIEARGVDGGDCVPTGSYESPWDNAFKFIEAATKKLA